MAKLQEKFYFSWIDLPLDRENRFSYFNENQEKYLMVCKLELRGNIFVFKPENTVAQCGLVQLHGVCIDDGDLIISC